jgi:hypothetical protein
MNSSTHSLMISAPRDKVFDFLSNVENLPKWATLFCREIKRGDDGRYRVVTPQGEIFFAIEADPSTGTIDMFGGADEDHMSFWPSRVIARPDGGSLFLFTAFQYPGMSDENFAAQCAGLVQEFPHIKAHVEA